MVVAARGPHTPIRTVSSASLWLQPSLDRLLAPKVGHPSLSSFLRYYPVLTASADSDSGSGSSSASDSRVKPTQPIPIPEPSKRNVVYLNPASTVAENLRKASAAATAAYNDSWHHRRHRQPGHDSRVKRQVETQGDYKIGKGGYARIKEGETLNHGRYEVCLLLY